MYAHCTATLTSILLANDDDPCPPSIEATSEQRTMLEGIPTRISLATLTLPTDIAYLYQMELLGTFLGAIAFGMMTVLLVNAVQTLRGDYCIYPKQMRTYLLCYTVFMFVVSLFATVQQIAFVIRRAALELAIDAPLLERQPQLQQTFALPFAVWGADAFLLWRCKLVYKDVSRVWTWLLVILMSFITLSSTGSGITFFLNEQFASTKLYNFPTLFIIGSSGFSNITLRSCIVGRIHHHRQYAQQAMGAHYTSIYTRIITMCIETCFLTSLCGFIFLALYFSGNHRHVLASVVPLTLLPHICCITPTILLVRTAQGRCMTELAVSGPVCSSDMTQSGHIQGKMEFNCGRYGEQSITEGPLFTHATRPSGKRRSILVEVQAGYVSSSEFSSHTHVG